jgi:hypothetical protein
MNTLVRIRVDSWFVLIFTRQQWTAPIAPLLADSFGFQALRAGESVEIRLIVQGAV